MFGECVDAPVTSGRQGRRSSATLQVVRQQPAPAPTVGEQTAQLAAQTSIDLSLLQKVPPALLRGLNPVMLRRAMINAAGAIQDGKQSSHESDPYAEGEQSWQALEDELAKNIMMLPLATRLPLLGKWSPSAIAAAGVPGSSQPNFGAGDAAGSGLLPVPGRGGAKRSDGGSRAPTATVLAEKAAVSFYDFGPAGKAKDGAVAFGARGSNESVRAKEKTKAKRREKGLEAAFAAVNDVAMEELPNDAAMVPGRLPLLEELNSKRRKADARMFMERTREIGPGEWEATPAQREQDAKKAALGALGNLERNKAAAEEASRISVAAGRPASGGADDSGDAGGWTSAPPARIFTEAGTAVARDGGKTSKNSAAGPEDNPAGWVFGRSRSRSHSADRDRDRDRSYRRGPRGGQPGARSESPPLRDADREPDRRGRRPTSARSRSRGRGGLPPRGGERDGSRRFSDGGRDRSPPRRAASSAAAAPADAKAGAGARPAAAQPDANPDAFLRQLGVRNGWAEFVHEKTGQKVFKNVLTGERTNKMPADYRTSISAVMDSRRLNWLAGLRGGGNPYGTIASGVRPPGM